MSIIVHSDGILGKMTGSVYREQVYPPAIGARLHSKPSWGQYFNLINTLRYRNLVWHSFGIYMLKKLSVVFAAAVLGACAGAMLGYGPLLR